MKALLLGMVHSDELQGRFEAFQAGRAPEPTREEVTRLCLEAMPPLARAAYLAGAERAREREKERAADAAHQAGPHRSPVLFNSVAQTTRTEPTMTMTIEEQDRARELIVQMNQPLSEQERKICQMVGVSEADYFATRNEQLAAKLPGGPDGLSASEREACRLLGMAPADFLKSKAELGAVR